ncbi:hypothetical protein [Bradyrhizobium sp. UFLA05-112]
MLRRFAPRNDEIGARARQILDVMARLDRAIQYSETGVIESIGRGVLDAPVKPGMTAVCGQRLEQLIASS